MTDSVSEVRRDLHAYSLDLARTTAALNVLIEQARSAADKSLTKVHLLEVTWAEYKVKVDSVEDLVDLIRGLAEMEQKVRVLETTSKDLSDRLAANESARWGMVASIVVAIISAVGGILTMYFNSH